MARLVQKNDVVSTATNYTKVVAWAAGMLLLVHALPVFGHSGMTDSSGGHNCYVGTCAGTYHRHNGASSGGGVGIIEIVVISLVALFLYRLFRVAPDKSSKGPAAKPKSSHLLERPVQATPNDSSKTKKSHTEKSYSRAFTTPISLELNIAANTIAWDMGNSVFCKWLLGYLSGYLLYAANPREPLVILEVGLWSQQAGWDRLKDNVERLIDTLGVHDQKVADLGLHATKPYLTQYLITDSDWLDGAKAGVKQAREYNISGTILSLINARWG